MKNLNENELTPEILNTIETFIKIQMIWFVVEKIFAGIALVGSLYVVYLMSKVIL